MKIKYISIFFIVFICLFISISAVSALDLNSSEKIMDNRNEHDFTWLKNQIDLNDSVDLGGATVKYNNATDSSLKNGIIIKKNINISNGFLDGNDKSRIFNVTNTGNLVLNNVILKNGHAHDGGAIYNSGIVYVNGDFINNYVDNFAGAIYNDGGNITIDGDFINNTAFYSYGAIYSNGGYITINGDFINNTAITNSVGAICADSCNVNVIGDFIGNVAGHYGAIYIERCNLSIKGNFIRNNVTWNGGVGYISKTNATMIGDFINNTAGMMFSLFINEIGSNTTIIGNFMNNTAERFGIANKGYINVKGNFTNNIADYGGALFNAGNCSIVGNFTNNIADYGGALFNAGNCSIVGNFTNNIADYGGALYNSGNMVIQGDFINNTAFKYGGALYNSGNMVIQGDFINNTANEYGGAIFVDGNLNCSYGIFYRNFANNTNSTVFIYSGNVDLSYNFWGCNNPNFTDLINSSNNYTMDNFFQVLLKCDVMNSTLTIGDELHYYVDLKLNTSGPFDLGKLSPINVNLRDNVNAILDEFIVQNNTAPNSRNTTVNNNLNYYNLYFYDNLLDVLIYKTKIRSLVSVNVENGFYNTTLEANITLCDVNGNNLTDDVIVTINGVNYTVNVVNGHAYFNISGLDSGNYSVAVIYNGNGNI